MVPSADGAATLAAALRKHRRAAGLSQERLAQQSGVSDRTIRNIEGGRVTTPRLSSLRALADALGIGGDERVRLMELATPDDEADVMEVGPGGRIPVPLTPLVGRAAERLAVDALLSASTTRLVTLTGVAGVGKTRLALAAATDVLARYAGGVWYVDLTPVTDPAMVGGAVSASLGFAEQLGQSPTDTVLARLHDVHALLVLDNCEHLVDGVVEFVERLLSNCPRVTVLATSRARLVVPFESVFPVPGLSLVDPGGDGPGDAVALFLDRAAMAGWTSRSDDDLRRIAAICSRLDGIALAIELAAVRVAALGLDGLEVGLARPLDLLAGAAAMDERHRSVRATLDWSYALLSPVEQAVLRRASVFAGAITPDVAARVVALAPVASASDVTAALAALADRSLLVIPTGPGGTRYRMLEAIRQYGAEQLDALGETVEVRGRHLGWCQAMAAAAVEEGPAGLRFDAVADDLRAALGWASGEPGQRGGAHDLALQLARLTFTRGMAREAQRRYLDAAGLAGDGDDASHAATDLDSAAGVALCRLDGADAVRLYLSAADQARRTGDQQGAAVRLVRAAEVLRRMTGAFPERPSPEEVETLRSEALVLAGDDPYVQAYVGAVLFDDYDSELATVERAIGVAVQVAEQVGDPRLRSAAFDRLATVRLVRGDVQAAGPLSRRRLELLGPLPSDPELAFEWYDALHMSAVTSMGAGDLRSARDYAQRRRDFSMDRENDHFVINWLLVLTALVGDWDDAVELAEQFRTGCERSGLLPRRGFATTLAAAAMVYGLRGDDPGRKWFLDTLARMYPSTEGDAPPGPREPRYPEMFDVVLQLHRGQIDRALETLSRPPSQLVGPMVGVWQQWYAALWAEASVLADRTDALERLAEARRISVGNPVASRIVDRAEALATGELTDLPRVAAALAATGCRYQQARTLVLAGGDHRTAGERMLVAMGAVPMAR